MRRGRQAAPAGDTLPVLPRHRPLRRLQSLCLERWALLERQLATCYPGLVLVPRPAELRSMLAAAATDAVP